MPVRVSTRVEEAWYVDPDLLAGEDDDQGQQVKFEIDIDGPLPRDMTVALGEGDLEELPEGLNTNDEGARHYRDVSLRGALLADETHPDDEPSWSERVFSKLKGRVPSLNDEHPSASRPPPAPLGAKIKPPPSLQVPSPAKAGFAASVVRIFEPGRVPPIVLAAIAFFAGVITTLLGVLLAL
jgi:hypothetical protein